MKKKKLQLGGKFDYSSPDKFQNDLYQEYNQEVQNSLGMSYDQKQVYLDKRYKEIRKKLSNEAKVQDEIVDLGKPLSQFNSSDIKYKAGFNSISPYITSEQVVPSINYGAPISLTNQDLKKIVSQSKNGVSMKNKKLQSGGMLVNNNDKKILFKNQKEFDSYYRNNAYQRMTPEDKLFYDDILSGKVKNIDANSFVAWKYPAPSYKDYMEGTTDLGGLPLYQDKAPYKTEYITDKSGNVIPKNVPIKDKKLIDSGYIPSGKNGLNIINDDRGQWAHPGKVTKINSNNITMKGVNTPLLGISDMGDTQMMYPNQDYKFKGNSVVEIPMAQDGMKFQNPSMNNFMDNIGGWGGIANSAYSIYAGAMKNREEKNQAEQFLQLSNIVSEAAGLAPEKVKRKYVRPEDQIIDPNMVGNSYGVGTNYLKNGGKVPKAFFGGMMGGGASGGLGGLGGMLGSKLGGGTGEASGASQVGSGLGGAVGGIFGPLGSMAGSAIGGVIGGVVGADAQKKQLEAQNKLEAAAFSQSMTGLQSQYHAFMKDGGELPLYDESMGISTLWGGKTNTISQNPYLPEGGNTVLFTGNTHSERDSKGNTGIGITFGKTPVEVENGEPAVKLKEGGTGESNLTIFGNMKIPSYGVSELGDNKAKNKKFKNYIKELSEQETKQGKIIDKSLTLSADTPVRNSFDKLTISSAKNMLIGADMKLKDIAIKKQTAADIQNAILETAEELNLDSDSLAKGKIKKAKMGKKIAQNGEEIPSFVSREDESTLAWLRELGFKPMEDNENRLYRTLNTEGSSSNVGGEEFNKWFKANYNNKTKGTTLDSPWGKILMEYGNRTSSPGTSNTQYVDLRDPLTGKIQPLPIRNPRIPEGITPIKQQTPISSGESKNKFNPLDVIGSVLPYIRPSNAMALDPNQLSGEMFALASNQVEPVQAQLYNPLLEQVSDISLQDQMNANQLDFNAILRQNAYNPSGQASLAAQKYAANSRVLGDQFRQNQSQRMNTYNRNRGVLNDATLKNLGILDQQYTRQSTARSNTKAVAQAALSSISDKIARNKLENKTLGVYENLYNYRFGPNGYAYNLNAPAQFNTQGANLPVVDNAGQVTSYETTQERDKFGNPLGSKTKEKTTVKSKKNGGIVKALKDF